MFVELTKRYPVLFGFMNNLLDTTHEKISNARFNY